MVRPKTQAKHRYKPVARLIQALTISNLWLSILSIAKNENVYAYSLPKDIDERFSFKPSRLMVYLVLYKLEAEGLLISNEEGQRKYYSLTDDGKKALEQGKNYLKKRYLEL
jgi:DNA-binding PadR family transcriptional regulator